MRLLLASGNAKKLRELRELCLPLDVEVVSPDDVGGLPEVVEDGATFAENAAKKARSGALASGLWCLADDSGLEVDHLDGAPGVHSARFAGRHGDDAANNRLLLERLTGVPTAERGARFRCSLCLVRPNGAVAAELDGRVEGRILAAPRGTGGFGYDPLFQFDEPHALAGRSFAELDPAAKAEVGHRGRAMRALAPIIERIRAAESEVSR